MLGNLPATAGAEHKLSKEKSREERHALRFVPHWPGVSAADSVVNSASSYWRYSVYPVGMHDEGRVSGRYHGELVAWDQHKD